MLRTFATRCFAQFKSTSINRTFTTIPSMVKPQPWRKFPLTAQLRPALPQLPQQRLLSAKARHKKIIKLAKGYRGRTNCFKMAKHRVTKARQYAYRDRKVKKREMRKLWIMRVNAACRMHGLPYRLLINYLKTSNIQLNRKMLAELAVSEPLSFKSITEVAKQLKAMK